MQKRAHLFRSIDPSRKIILSLLILFSFLSCENKSDPETEQVVLIKKDLDTVTSIPAKSSAKIFVDTVRFIEYNDDSDYFLLIARKNKEDLYFINDNNEDRSFLNGDLLKIEWKSDTIYIAGDGETVSKADWILSAKKIKEGPVSVFRKNYQKPLKYHWAPEENYSTSYLDKVYLIVEHYIATSENEMIRSAIARKEQLEYSLEKKIRDEKEYTMIGISTVLEHRVSTLQWLFYGHDSGKLFEYDLGNDRLIEYK